MHINDNHVIFQHRNFQKISANDRVGFLKKQRFHFNWFSTHSVKNCISKFSCSKCGKKHSTQIHFEKTSKKSIYNVLQQIYNLPHNVNEKFVPNELNLNTVSFETNNVNMPENTSFVENFSF